eukprot:TRINITY_DN749_c0_g1_i2.p1 TRINITY_DN749_c0_g1~~TRINITY_DN749_c0_g1_i2.p1  ORF type:complete len:717 (-),score=133.34 TRINITY_DN749_c0_g1_i2:23-2173(-)
MSIWIALNLVVSACAFWKHKNLTSVFHRNKRSSGFQRVEENDSEDDAIELLSSADSVQERDSFSLSCAFIDYRVNQKHENYQEAIRNLCDARSKQILNSVTAQFRPGTLTAIMGPSGSGKTTLLNLLSGRTRTGSMEGYRLINNHSLNAGEFNEVMRKNSGYVLQTDTFFKDLTVRETLLFAAMLRLDPDEDMDVRVNRVDQVITEVGLEKVAKTKVGDEFTTGLSGGQKRRLSIAVELLNVPSIILLDEPTSGLDASTAHTLILLLKKLAEKYQRTIVTTIHSPRPESFAVFDDIMLLGKGGDVVYTGPASDALEYFELSGFNNTEQLSPGDFIIDIVGLDPEDTDETIDSYKLADTYRDSDIRRDLVDTIIDNMVEDQYVPKSRKRLGFWEETCVLFSRRISRSTLGDYLSMFAQMLFIGLLLALAFGGKGFDSINIWYRPYKSLMFIVCLVSYGMVIQYLNLVPQYFDERNILRRELENGSCRITTYILSCMLYETPMALFQVVFVSVVGYWLVDLNTDIRIMIFFVLFFTIGVSAWQAVVCLFSFMSNDMGRVYNFIFVLLGVGTLFSGLPIVYSNIPSYFIPFYYTSVPAITYRALLHSELICCNMTFDCSDLTDLGSQYINGTQQGPSIEETKAACEAQLDDQKVNLGAMALFYLDLNQEIEYIDMVVLMGLIVLLRFLAIFVFKFKVWNENRLKDTTEISIKERKKFVL